MFNTPILFLIFNRPDTTERVFEKIREIKPKQLFIAADGPREGNERDEVNCKAVREIATKVDWECEVNVLFREENLGCGLAVSKAITWFFENVEEGIILEDDTLPDLSFFSFCSEMLLKYSANERIMSITGLNWQDGIKRGSGSYYFSAYPGIWGWATWKSRWEKYKYELKERDIDRFIESGKLKRVTNSRLEKEYHLQTIIESLKVDTWDFQWKFTVFDQQGFCVVPNNNLIKNIGFGINATHTRDSNSSKANRKTENLIFPLLHPEKVERNFKADDYTASKIFNRRTTLQQLRLRISNVIYNEVEFKKPISITLFFFRKFKKKFSKPGTHIFIACLPKSGSTFLANTLNLLTGYEFKVFISSYGRNEHDLYLPDLIDYYSKNTVTHQHVRATPSNLRLMDEFGISPIILVRNIFDCVVSLKDHIINESHLWPMAYVDNTFHSLNETEKIDFVIEFFVPWYLDFFVSWINEVNNGYACLVITYEQLIESKEETIRDILSFCKIEQQFNRKEISETFQKTSGPGIKKSRFNKGIVGRGKETLTEEQRNRIIYKASLYRSVDFSLIGINMSASKKVI